MNGGYDDGYKSCHCFWGTEPGSLIRRLNDHVKDLSGLAVLDAGCGEGKNAAFFAAHNAVVRAFDVSPHALENARRNWPSSLNVQWEMADVRDAEVTAGSYDVVIAYGLLHCLSSNEQVLSTVERLKMATRVGGYNVICAFNDRYQELHAHPGFSPVLLPHSTYLSCYSDWKVVFASDEDLHEVHPHNGVPHTHSMTRLIAQKES